MDGFPLTTELPAACLLPLGSVPSRVFRTSGQYDLNSSNRRQKLDFPAFLLPRKYTVHLPPSGSFSRRRATVFGRGLLTASLQIAGQLHKFQSAYLETPT